MLVMAVAMMKITMQVCSLKYDLETYIIQNYLLILTNICNNAECDYDGGDCCGGCTDYCTKCECKNCVDRMPTKRCMDIKKRGDCGHPYIKINCAKTCGSC